MVSLRIKKHRQVGSNIGINQQTISEVPVATTYVEEKGIDSKNVEEQVIMSCMDLLEHIPSWYQTGKRGRDKIIIVDDNQKIDNKIYNVMPLSVYYGLEVSLTTQTRFQVQNLLVTSSKSKCAKTMKSEEHRCEICGNTFPIGQALGGHKTYHRTKPVAVDTKLAGKTAEIIDFINRNRILVLPMELYGKGGDSSEDFYEYQQHPIPKKLLDIDLNIPYVG